MARRVTMLELVQAIAAHARTDAEVVATVVYLVNSGKVRLCGAFAGARFDLGVGLRPARPCPPRSPRRAP
ncbi:MAG: hypothetical protein U0807_13725 [Candidatus Binatia bacterium]